MKSITQATRDHGGPMVGSRPVRVEALVAAMPQPAPPDRVRLRAYEIFRAREASGGAGDATSDWLEAERELTGHADAPAVEPLLRS